MERHVVVSKANKIMTLSRPNDRRSTIGSTPRSIHRDENSIFENFHKNVACRSI
jgi:hypothetical protein